MSHPAVKEAAVVGRCDAVLGQCVFGFIKLAAGTKKPVVAGPFKKANLFENARDGSPWRPAPRTSRRKVLVRLRGWFAHINNLCTATSACCTAS